MALPLDHVLTSVVNENGLRRINALLTSLTTTTNSLSRDNNLYMNKLMEIEEKFKNLQRYVTETEEKVKILQRYVTEQSHAESLRIEDIRSDISSDIRAIHSKMFQLETTQVEIMKHIDPRR